MSISYHPLTPRHFPGVITLGNMVHGANYLAAESLQTIYNKSFHNGINASWVAMDTHKVVGFRLTLAHTQWQPDKWCSPSHWPVATKTVCYFKCNTVAPAHQGQNIGSTMLKYSIDSAKKQGAEAGLAHIWLASPGNSAFLYFRKNGGQLIRKHPDKWRYEALYEGYDCPVCETLCNCEGAEMLLKFS